MRFQSCNAASYTGDARFLPLLIAMANKDSDLAVRANASFAVGFMGGDDALDCLLDVIKRNDEHLMPSAGLFLAQTQDERAVEPVVKLAHNQNPGVSDSAIRGLEQMRLPAARTALLDLAKDTTDERRRQIFNSLAQAAAPEAIDAQIELVKKGTREERNASADALCCYLYHDIRVEDKLRIRAAFKEYEKTKNLPDPPKKEEKSQPAMGDF